MTNTPVKHDPVAIRIEGCRNVRLDDNVSVGIPLLHANDVENLSGSGNRAFVYDDSVPAPVPVSRKAWHEHALVKIGVSIIITVVAGGILFAFGWK